MCVQREQNDCLSQRIETSTKRVQSTAARKTAVASTQAQQCIYIVTTTMAMVAAKSHKCEYLPIRMYLFAVKREKKTSTYTNDVIGSPDLFPPTATSYLTPSISTGCTFICFIFLSLALKMVRKNSVHNLIAVCRCPAFCFTISY